MLDDDDTISMVSMASTTTCRDRKKKKAKEIINKLKKDLLETKQQKQKNMLLNVQFQGEIARLKETIKELQSRNNSNEPKKNIENSESNENKEREQNLINIWTAKLEDSKKAFDTKQEELDIQKEECKKVVNENKALQGRLMDMKKVNDELRCQIIDINLDNQQKQKSIEKEKSNTNVQLDRAFLKEAKKQCHSIKTQFEVFRNDTSLMLNRYIENETNWALTNLTEYVEDYAAQLKAEAEFEAKEFCGYFMKQGARRKSWRKRWFIFRSDLTFEYFKSSQPGQKPLNTASCRNRFDVHVDATMNKSFCFRIVTDKRVFFLVASNADECHRTIQRLRLWQEVNQRRLRSRSSSLASSSTTSSK